MGAGSLALQGKTVTQARSNAPRNPCSATQYWNTSQNGFSENFQYDNMNRLWTSQVTTNISAPQQTFTYDSIGDIASKTGVGTGNYVYPASGANAVQPHAVSSIPGIGSFSYDANGNMLAGAGRGMSWNSFDMPITMTEGSNSSAFVYGPEHQRTKQTRGDGTVIFYAGAMEADLLNGNTTVKTYWPLGLGVEIDAPGATSSALNWTHTDRLGSVVAITDGSGNLAQSMAYDAWGSRRDLAGDPGVITVSANGQLGGQNEIDNKGYTGQEMLDQLQLVHLNGRVYDPFTARFISADPEIQDPTHSQSYNRYTYVWNNPTNDTDLTGFSCNDPQDGGDCVIIGHLNATDASSAENGMFTLVRFTSIGNRISNFVQGAPGTPQRAFNDNLDKSIKNAVDGSGCIKSGSATLCIGLLGIEDIEKKLLAKLLDEFVAKTETELAQQAKDTLSKNAAKEGEKALTTLYQKLGPNGEHLKYGITNNPATRYTEEELAGGSLKKLAEGSRKDMLKLERDLHETLPIGPEEGQKFYIQKQFDKGLTPPPYNQ